MWAVRSCPVIGIRSLSRVRRECTGSESEVLVRRLWFSSSEGWVRVSIWRTWRSPRGKFVRREIVIIVAFVLTEARVEWR